MTKLAVPKTRILALAALGVGVVAGAAGAAIWVAISSNGSWHEASDPGVRVDLPQDSNHAPGEPWFRKQEGPPEFLTDDNRTSPALMPHRDDSKPGSTPARPYEEALPETVHLTAPSDSDTNTVAVPSPAARPTGMLPPWRKFAVAVPPADGRKQIAIVIDDAGIDRKRTARAIRLPGPLTISFLTYAEDLPRQTAAAHAAGHELLVHMAMEPTSKAVDPGPNVLRISDDARSIRNKLSLGLSRFGGYVGINNHMGSRFTADAAGMDVVMAMLHERGLMFLDSRTSGGTVGAPIS